MFKWPNIIPFSHKLICLQLKKPQEFGQKQSPKLALLALRHSYSETYNDSVSCGGASCIRSCTHWLFLNSFLCWCCCCQGICCWAKRECDRSPQPSLLWAWALSSAKHLVSSEDRFFPVLLDFSDLDTGQMRVFCLPSFGLQGSHSALIALNQDHMQVFTLADCINVQYYNSSRVSFYISSSGTVCSYWLMFFLSPHPALIWF